MASERKSKINVNVIDFAKFCKTFKEKNQVKLEKENKTGNIEIRVPSFAYVNTPNGLFIIDNDGTGETDPITKKNKTSIPVYVDRVENGHRYIGMFPTATLEIDDEEILSMPIIQSINLADFIRTFGRRLESNFNLWNKFLEEQLNEKTSNG